MTKRAREMMYTVRDRTFEITPDDEPLFFYAVAKEMGLRDDEADDIDTELTTQIMRAKGAI